MVSRRLLLAFALLNGILYCCTLPLWEGFDEPFHYSYVQLLSQSHQLPVLDQTHISLEVERSFQAVPLSRLLSGAIPGSVSFEEWSKLAPAEKSARRNALRLLTPQMQTARGTSLNYEAQQSPLAYFLLTPFDWLFSRLPLGERVLWLRLLATIAGVIAIVFALDDLASTLGLRGVFHRACLAVCLEVQMLWAAIAHVGNDVLAVALTIWFLALLAKASRSGSQRDLVCLIAVFAAGLLTKAYFLTFAPLVLVLFAWQLLAQRISGRAALACGALLLLVDGPWFARNVVLYHTISGTQESARGVGLSQALAAFPQIHWLRSGIDFAFWSLWTGNWSFLSFSKSTISIELLLLAAAFLCFLLSLRRAEYRRSELWLLAACALFLCGLVYQTCVTWVASNGVSTHPEPWYAQGVAAVGIVLCFRGLAVSGWLGRGIAAALVLIAAWIAALTYPAKLLPFYGAAINRANIGSLSRWWRTQATADLGTVTLVPPAILYLLLIALLVMLVVLSSKLIGSLAARAETPSA